VEEDSGAQAEAVGRGYTEAEVLGRVVGSKGQQDTPAVCNGARVVGSEALVEGRKVPVGSGAQVVGGSEALGKVVAVGMQGKARDKALAEVEEDSEAQAEVQDREHIEALGRAGGMEGRQAGQGSEEEGKKALGEVLGLVQPQVQQGQVVVDEGTQVERKVVEWVVHSVEVEEDRRG